MEAQFDIHKTTGVVCEECKNPTFRPVVFLRKIIDGWFNIRLFHIQLQNMLSIAYLLSQLKYTYYIYR